MSKRMNAKKPMKKVPPQTEGNTPKGARKGGGSTTRASKARENRLAKVAM